MIVYVIVFFIGLFIFLGMSKCAQVLFFIANLFIPDPLPFIDEVIMLAIILRG